MPYAAHADTLRAVAPQLAGKILVDATVPLRPPKVGTVQLPAAGSAALEAKALLGDGVTIVSALQTIAAHQLAQSGEIACDVLAASDDAAAVERVSALLAELGLRTWHIGPLANAAASEALTSVLIQINRRYNVSHAGVRITGRPKDAPSQRKVSVEAIGGLPLLAAGDDLAALIIQALKTGGQSLQDGDVIVIAQKAVSKVEGRAIILADVTPSQEALEIAEKTQKHPHVVELINAESETLMRVRPGLIITRHRLGHVAANAGIDASNVAPTTAPESVLLWPKDPDASARALREALQTHLGVRLAIIVSDSLGRAWRLGTTGSAIGIAGMKPVRDRRGEHDLFGRILQATEIGVADEIAAAASLVIGEAAEGLPAAIVRGAIYEPDENARVTDMLRPRADDLFP